ncbi:MAG TPA: hypothetical protein VNX47_14085, partial [Nevskia sp.]|nr:hypothetical protein [Nevskia sp.]
MRPLHLHLRNFKGIKAGLNRDVLDLDLRDYRGLVALMGPNGIGKTTVIDNLQPFRIQAFKIGRESTYTEGCFSIYGEVTGDAEKVLEWTHGGRMFKSDIQINTNTKTPTTKAYLFVRAGDAWEPYVAPDGTRSDGKAATYDHGLRTIIGEPELFFTAQFAAQERKRLADYGTGDMKLLLSELLDLNHLLELSDKAGKRATALGATLEAMQPRLRDFDQAQAALDAAMAALSGATAALEQHQSGRDAARARLASAGRLLAEANANATRRDEIRRRRTNIEAEIERLRREGGEATGLLQRSIAQENGAAAAIRRELDTLRQRLTDLQERANGARARLAALPDPAAAEQAAGAAQIVLDANRASLEAAAAEVEALAEWPAKLAALRERRAAINISGPALKKEAETEAARALLAQRVPCAGMAINSTCELLASARTSAAKKVEIEPKLEALRTELEQIKVDFDAATAKVADHQGAVQRRDAARQAVDKAQAAVSDAAAQQRRAAAAAEIQGGIERDEAEITTIQAHVADRED